MVVVMNDKKDLKKEIPLCSNTIHGGINPGQFWKKPGYRPGGIMDPYFD
jgi:hypothetical protein